MDKLSLNNVIQDNTYMKDYLAYQMMNEFGVSAPLCSFAYITVNGEDWGLYLAVEGVEALKTFCAFRSESVALQLSGSEESVIAEGLNISDMGTMGGGMGGGFDGERDFSTSERGEKPETQSGNIPSFSGGLSSGQINGTIISSEGKQNSETNESNGKTQNPWGNGMMPDMGDFDINNIPDGEMQIPGNMQNGQIPRRINASVIS